MRCKRYDCLYHPDYREKYGCDYMLLTGQKRESKPGKKCNKYVQATLKEQLSLRRKVSKVSFCISDGEVRSDD